MSFPILLEIERFQSALQEFPLSDSWRIPTVKSDDIIWNIALAYLNSIPCSDESELTKRLTNLTNDQRVNKRLITFVQKYNPFLHRDACFRDEEMSKLVSSFKDRVDSYIKKNEKKLQPNTNNFRYLEASSKLLSCHILLLSFYLQNKIAITIFPIQDSSRGRKIYPNHILIVDEFIFTNGNNIPKESFAFCISKEIGMKKKRQALSEILNTTEMSTKFTHKTVQEVCDLPGINESFLLSLLKSDFGRVVTFIYKSPCMLSNLENAGFKMDPRLKDETGKSAIFYALKIEQWHLVTLFYDNYINSCLMTDASMHSDLVILENLRHMKDDLELLGKDLECDEISDNSKCLFRDLCLYNIFQIELFSNINNINLELNDYDCTEEEYEFLRRKQKILAILKTYFKFRRFKSKSTLEAGGEISQFEEFHDHINFFEKLDGSLAMIFLNDIFYEKVPILYSKVVSYFFRFIFFRNLLERCEKNNYDKQWIQFQESLYLEKQMRKLKEIVGVTNFSNHDLQPNLHELRCNLEIYENVFLLRLQHYLNAVTLLTVIDQKSILVIERCLYVLGDSCQINSFNFYKSKFYSALPKKFVKLLKKICPCTSRIHTDVLLSRKMLEQDVKLFEAIQKELIKLQVLLLPVYLANQNEMDKLLLSHIDISVGNINSSISIKRECELEQNLLFVEKEEIWQSILTSKSQEPCDPLFDDVYSWLTKQLFDPDFKVKIMDKDTYKNVLQNSFSFLSTLCNSKLELDYEILQLESQFRYFEKLLSINAGEHNLKLQLLEEKRKFLFHLNWKYGLDWMASANLSNFKFLLEDYESLVNTICAEFTQDSEEQFHFENILEYCFRLHCYACLNKEELSATHSDSLNVDSDEDIFSELNLMHKSEVAREFELGSKNLEGSENKKVPDSQFTFLRDRIKMLKNILSENISQLLERAATPQKKILVKEKILQLYMSDYKIQASVEMIIFDCMNILNSKKLKKQWESNTDLFSGINLSKVLACGHSLYSCHNSYIPYYYLNDSLDELMDQIVKLIADENVLDSIQEILVQSGTNFSGFMRFMNDEESKQFQILRKQILQCDDWKKYALLIHF